jgi:hypothetical protein
MSERLNTSMTHAGVRSERNDAFDLDALLHPASAFHHPSQVVNDADLTLNEKRAILASWASDACAVEAAPALRQGSGGRVVPFDDIMEALRTLDRQQATSDDAGRYRRAARWARIARLRGGGRGRSDQGQPLF